MYTKILLQIVLIACFSEYIPLPVQAAQVQVLQQSTKPTANDNNTRQNQKISLQSTVSSSASPVSTTTPQTQPDNQQKVNNINSENKNKNKSEAVLTEITPEILKKSVVSNAASPASASTQTQLLNQQKPKVGIINSDNKNKNKSEAVLTEITPEIIKKTAVTNSAPALLITAKTQPQPANQQKQNAGNINSDNKNKNKSESVLAVATSEKIKEGDKIQIPTPEVPSAKGLLNNKDDPQEYDFEEVEDNGEYDDEEEEEEEEEDDYEENYTENNPIQLNKPKLNPSTTTEPENVNNGNINQEINHLSKSGTPPYSDSFNNNNNYVDYNNYGDEYTIEEEEMEEEEEDEDENDAEQQPTHLKKNQIESIKEDTNQRLNSKLSKSGTTLLDSLPNYRAEDQDHYYNEDLEQPWQNNENKPHLWSPRYQEEYDNFSQDELSPSSNALNKETPRKYEEYEGYYNVGSTEEKNKQKQLPSTFNANNEYSNIYKTPNYITGESVHNNEFESQQYIDRQSYSNEEMESEESSIDNGSSNTQFSEEEKILNGYKIIKKILNMLHDYASSTFNWIINTINSQIEKVESNQTDKISSN